MSFVKDRNQIQLIDKILALKKNKNAVIFAHNYQIGEIQDIADHLGDSLELAKISRAADSNYIVFCGVRFMAETAKILSPHKKVYHPVPEAGCPLAEMITVEQLKALKAKYPKAWVVSYVNSTAEIKALSDVCCTSANAINVVKNVPSKQVIFVPDKHLGRWVQKNVLDKEIILGDGFCLVHQAFTLSDLKQAKDKHPQALVVVHPECKEDILDNADYVVSTSGMLKIAKESSAKTLIIGTEEGLIYRLQKDYPDKEFFSLGKLRVCVNMKKITLIQLHHSLQNDVYEVNLDKEIMDKARVALERMVEYV